MESSEITDIEDGGRTQQLRKDNHCADGAEPGAAAVEKLTVERLTVDQVLEKWVGEFGWGQFWHFLFVSLAWTIESMHTLVMIFADKDPEWRCTNAPSSNSTYLCSPSSNICDLDPGSWEWSGPVSASSVSQFGLICGDHYKVGLVQSSFFIGCLIGAGLFGNLSDSFLGRKGSLVLACTMSGLAGIATALSPNYYFYLAIRGLAGVGVGGVGLSSFVLATEPIGPSKRGQAGMSAFYFFSTGIMSLPALAYFTQSWRAIYMVISVPALLYACTVLPFVSESPRWYLVKGRVDDAMTVLRAVAKRNGKSVPPGVTVVTDEEDTHPEGGEAPPVLRQGGTGCDCEEQQRQRGREGSGSSSAVPAPRNCSGSLVDVFRLRTTRWRMVIMIFVWFASAVVYFGISLNVVNLGFNLYLAVFFNGLVELPAFAITAGLIGRVGRKPMVVATMLISGAACLLGALFRDTASSSDDGGFGSHFAVARLLCGVVGIFGMAGTYNLIFMYTCELFPTVVRNAALGLATQAGQIGAVIAPLVAGLGQYDTSIPFIAFGVPAILGGLSVIGLPETLHKPMLDTMDQMKPSHSCTESRKTTCTCSVSC